MKLILLLIILFLTIQSLVKSQTSDSTSFVPDRPGMATPPAILGTRSFQIEDGFQHENTTDGITQYENYLFSSLLVRYGISKHFEVRIQTDYAENKERSTSTSSITGLNPVTIGSKIKLVRQQKILPNISLLLNVTFPYVGKKEFLPYNPAPSFYILMSNDITQKLNVCYNYGMIWDGSSSSPTHFSALSLGANLDSRWSTFIEGYGFSNQSTKPAYYIDAGFAYLITGHLQIDLSAAGSLNSFTNYYMLNTGIAWKI
jgi:hypothetical protein